MRFKDFAAANDGTRTDQMSLPPWKIQVQPGYNPRDPALPEVQEWIRHWADVVLSGGWNPAYPFLIRWDGEIAWMREGHCRQAGIALAATKAYRDEYHERTGLKPADPVVLVKCDLTPPLTNEIDDLFIPLSSQAKLPLTPEGWIEQIRKIAATGLEKKAIVHRLGQLGQKADFVRRMFDLAEAPVKVRKAVAEEKISPTLAVNTMRSEGRTKGAATIERAIAAGGGHARPRHVREVSDKPRTEPVSLCSLAIAVIWEWRNGGEGMEVAMAALEKHLGPLVKARAA